MIAKYIDHTLLNSAARREDIVRLCQEAEEWGFRGVCINPVWIPVAATFDSKIITVIDFPLGASEIAIKIAEAVLAVDRGADELDVVWNLGNFLEGKYLQTTIELTTLVEQVAPIPVKIIVETCCFQGIDFKNAYKIVEDCGAFCIKTSTGYGACGATFNDVARLIGLGNLKIKASGGISTYVSARAFFDMGANIIGTSRGLHIIQGEQHANNIKSQ